ncbi:unnamed protein product, partial [marine sediment metagenome]
GADTRYYASEMKGSLFTSPADTGTANFIAFYVRSGWFGTTCYKGVLVLHSTMTIVANGVGNPVCATDSAWHWQTSTFATPPIVTPSTGYDLSMIGNQGQTNESIAYDDGDANQGYYDDTNSYANPIDPTDDVRNIKKLSIYCDYNVAAPPGGSGGEGAVAEIGVKSLILDLLLEGVID